MADVPDDPPRRLYLSPPHMGSLEPQYLNDALCSGWVAPLGPHVDAFEHEVAERLEVEHAVATSSGTAALHLALLVAGVKPGDEVFVSTLTFVASVNAIRYVGATPVLVDAESGSWNLDPALLTEALEARARHGRLPRAVIVVHLFGQTADMDPILAVCEKYGVVVIEDAAEALGAHYRGRPAGSLGPIGTLSFNGNKIITTSGGGMLLCREKALADRVRKLATQARDPAPHYEHSELGYNYRLSNLLAAVGRGQLAVLDERVSGRRRNYEYYRENLGSLSGINFQPDAGWGLHTRWLTVLTVDARAFGADRECIRRTLEADNIEARPVWKPMHLQPLYRGCETVGGAVSEGIFREGLCLPSGSDLDSTDLARVVEAVLRAKGRAQAAR